MALATRCPHCETVFRLDPHLARAARRPRALRALPGSLRRSHHQFELRRRPVTSRPPSRWPQPRAIEALSRRSARKGPDFSAEAMGPVGAAPDAAIDNRLLHNAEQSAAHAGLHRRGRRGHAAPRCRAGTAGVRAHESFARSLPHRRDRLAPCADACQSRRDSRRTRGEAESTRAEPSRKTRRDARHEHRTVRRLFRESRRSAIRCSESALASAIRWPHGNEARNSARAELTCRAVRRGR